MRFFVNRIPVSFAWWALARSLFGLFSQDPYGHKLASFHFRSFHFASLPFVRTGCAGLRSFNKTSLKPTLKTSLQRFFNLHSVPTYRPKGERDTSLWSKNRRKRPFGFYAPVWLVLSFSRCPLGFAHSFRFAILHSLQRGEARQRAGRVENNQQTLP